MDDEFGTVLGICVAPTNGESLATVQEVDAVSGQGLQGDRYCNSRKPHKGVTLIEVEAVEALSRDYGISLTHPDTRRNILTRGVALNHLVDRTFRVGGATLRGVELCEPCGYLERKTRRGVRKGLVHRGGLRAEILQGGPIRVGDAVRI